MGLDPYASGGGRVTSVVQQRAGQPGTGTHLDAAGNVIDDATGQIIIYADGSTPQDRLTAEQRAQLQAENARDPVGDFVGDHILSGNPVAGVANATIDAVTGHPLDAAGDLVNGASMGVISAPKTSAAGKISNSPGVGITPPGYGSTVTADQIGGAIEGAAGAGLDAAGNLVQGIGSALAPATADPSGLSAVRDRAFNTQDALTGRIQRLEQNPTVAPQSDLVQLDQTNIDPLRARQTGALDLLTDAATGRVPSAAEILGREQANRAAAQAYGTAAALQGGQSSGGTLRQALDAQTQLQGDANTQLMAARAKEMEAARGQLVQGIGAARGQESADTTTNANLAQNRNLANTQAAITTHGQDVSQQGDLISGQNAALATGAAAEKAKVDAETANAASANALKGAEIGGAAGVIGHIVDPKSDRRSKTGVRSVDLVQLADDLPGYTFDYKDAQDGPGRRVGVMAQDAAKARMGRDLVRLGDDGDLVLDGANSLGAALAMSAEALRKAEAARKRR